MTTDPDVRCADGCGRPATTERLVGVADPALNLLDDLTLTVELVCVPCAAGQQVHP